MPVVLPPLNEWATFYVIIGSSAAALTGLQFVVIALSANTREGGEAELQAFATPTIVHFCAVLTISVLFCMPGQTPASLSLFLSVGGLLGLAYASVVAYRAQRTTVYKPVLEDWICHVGLPFVGYACLLIVGITVRRHPASSLYVTAATALLLLFIAIHNAWDAAVYLAARKAPPGEEQGSNR